MKLLKKIAAIMLSIMMVLGMASVVSADSATTSGTSATTGKITINSARAGQTYKIYKLLDLESYDKTNNLYSYKPAAKWENFFKTNGEGSKYVDINENGYVTWKDGADAVEFAQKALAHAKSQSIAAEKNETVATGSNTVIFDNLDLGYYLVESSVGALCGLTTTNNEATIKEKNGVPSVEKKVQEDSKVGKTDEWGDSNTADIGQTVNFQTTITAQPGAQNYVLHDKMDTGLTFGGTVTVKKGDTILASPKDYSLITDAANITDDCTFEIAFTPAFCGTLAENDKIIVTYSATLNDDVESNKEYTNETWLKYGDNNETNHDTTKTKTFELPVFKYTMKNSTETPLADAIFTLSKNASGSDPIELVSVSKDNTAGDTYRVAKTNETGAVTTVTTTASGKFTIKGLDADTYYLTETKQPDGYNKLKDPIKVKISDSGQVSILKSASDGTETSEDITDYVKVQNNTGSLLPSTGGSGTTMIYILGAVLVLGSSVVLITKKRMR